ncbi:MAG: Uma2 family endonuclease [Cyanobacteria bacterium P01_H01_bin.121]
MGEPLILQLPQSTHLTNDQFYELCQANPELRIERSAKGELILMPPTGGETGRRNLKILQQLGNWADHDGTGIAFDSSTCFKLPNGAERSPDAAWLTLERWNQLTPEQKEKFPPLCPDFVIELRSATDALKPLQTKLEEYIENGASLGWLIDPQNRHVEIYRQDQAKTVLSQPVSLTGAGRLASFTLTLNSIC